MGSEGGKEGRRKEGVRALKAVGLVVCLYHTRAFPLGFAFHVGSRGRECPVICWRRSMIV